MSIDPFSGCETKGSGKKAESFTYKIWNNNVKDPIPTPTPGVVMIRSEKKGDEWVRTKEIVESVRCVILFGTPSRFLKRSDGSVACASSDGHRPKDEVKVKGCEAATTDDLVKIMSAWKGFNKTKVDEAVSKLVGGDGKLSFCSLDGKIPLCPQARKDPFTGKVNCQSAYTLFAYDLERERKFKMELTGTSQYNNQNTFIAPIFSFMKQVFREKGKCFNYVVKLSPMSRNGVYVANFEPLGKVSDDALSRYSEMAHVAFDRYRNGPRPASVAPSAESRDVNTTEDEDVFG